MTSRYGDWEIVESLAEGGQAHIFLVQHKIDQRKAVLKRLKNSKRLERFKTEFKVMYGGDGKFFPRIYDENLEAEKPYYVMEYFQKGSLADAPVSKWSMDQKLRFYVYLVLAVAYANNEGTIHRDLKPANVLVTDDDLPRVSDFGICYVDDYGTRQTMADEAVGSFRFMAPEMEDGRADKIAQHTDIYSLGKIAYWLFAGEIYNREQHREPKYDLTKRGSEPWRHYFNDFLDKVTAHNPDLRPQNTAELITEFEQVRRSIVENIRYLNLQIEQTCSFCRFGKYKIAVDALDPNKGGVSVHNFGINPVGASLWLILVCDRCGNVQLFRKDHAKQWSWKGT